METFKGHFLVPTPRNDDHGLWFIFHHESDGILAVDLTRPHPDIPHGIFLPLIDSADSRSIEKTVLYGGDNQPDNAMIVLHNGPLKGDESHIIDKNFSFLSYRYVLIPGRPPVIERSNSVPGRLSFAPKADFLIVMGFRLWNMDDLERELQDWQWNFLPAVPQIVFHTKAAQRLSKARALIN
jgi:putative AlgH/UPF0301 family transcriptional regulator